MWPPRLLVSNELYYDAFRRFGPATPLHYTTYFTLYMYIIRFNETLFFQRNILLYIINLKLFYRSIVIKYYYYYFFLNAKKVIRLLKRNTTSNTPISPLFASGIFNKLNLLKFANRLKLLEHKVVLHPKKTNRLFFLRHIRRKKNRRFKKYLFNYFGFFKKDVLYNKKLFRASKLWKLNFPKPQDPKKKNFSPNYIFILRVITKKFFFYTFYIKIKTFFGASFNKIIFFSKKKIRTQQAQIFFNSYHNVSYSNYRRPFNSFLLKQKKRFCVNKNLMIKKYHTNPQPTAFKVINFLYNQLSYKLFSTPSVLLYKPIWGALILVKNDFRIMYKKLRFLNRKVPLFDLLILTSIALTNNVLFFIINYLNRFVRVQNFHTNFLNDFFMILRVFFYTKELINGIRGVLTGPYNRHSRTKALFWQLGNPLKNNTAIKKIVYDATILDIQYGSVGFHLWIDYLLDTKKFTKTWEI